MRAKVTFEDWVRRAAMELVVDNDDYAPDAPGSFSEAANYLTSQEALGPNETGLPASYKVVGDEEVFLVAVYLAFCLPIGDSGGNLGLFTNLDARHEGNFVDVVGVAWEAGNKRGAPVRARTFLSERGTPLSFFSCRNLDDLRRLYEHISSSIHDDVP